MYDILFQLPSCLLSCLRPSLVFSSPTSSALTLSSFFLSAFIFVGWKISPIAGNPNACFQYRIVQLDPKGWIPVQIVNLFKNKAGESLVQQRRVFAGELGLVPT